MFVFVYAGVTNLPCSSSSSSALLRGRERERGMQMFARVPRRRFCCVCVCLLLDFFSFAVVCYMVKEEASFFHKL